MRQFINITKNNYLEFKQCCDQVLQVVNIDFTNSMMCTYYCKQSKLLIGSANQECKGYLCELLLNHVENAPVRNFIKNKKMNISRLFWKLWLDHQVLKYQVFTLTKIWSWQYLKKQSEFPLYAEGAL